MLRTCGCACNGCCLSAGLDDVDEAIFDNSFFQAQVSVRKSTKLLWSLEPTAVGNDIVLLSL